MPGQRLPHAFPYQGSKRKLAADILRHFPPDVDCLLEPFCGAAALSVAAAANGAARRFLLNDINQPLMALWADILHAPRALADSYEQLWRAPDPQARFEWARRQFNHAPQPPLLLYLLARIAKGAIRYNRAGAFNQSADKRRAGMQPRAMRRNLLGVSALLAPRTQLSARQFTDAIAQAGAADLIYLDPPYQGTSQKRDHRYVQGLPYDTLVAALESLNQRNLSYILSYDGATGDKEHGRPLPPRLRLRHLHIAAGRSAQSTLMGGAAHTTESLYLSPALVARLQQFSATIPPCPQMAT